MSGEWEALYTSGSDDARWPWSDLVSLVGRYAKIGPKSRVLELGPGTGANVPFFLSTGCFYWGLEGSESACQKIWGRYPGILCTHHDFTQSLPHDFDLIADRASLPHNTYPAIQRTLSMAHNALVSGGLFVGVDWFSDMDSYPERFAEMGTTTRLSYRDMTHLFEGWKIEHMEHVERDYHDGPWAGKCVATWNVVAKKV